MLILTPSCVAALVGEFPLGDGIFSGDFGFLMKPLLLGRSGDLSSFIGEFISLLSDVDEADDEEEDEDERSEEGFLRQTSRCRSIEPGNVRGGTRFCGNGPG